MVKEMSERYFFFPLKDVFGFFVCFFHQLLRSKTIYFFSQSLSECLFLFCSDSFLLKWNQVFLVFCCKFINIFFFYCFMIIFSSCYKCQQISPRCLANCSVSHIAFSFYAQRAQSELAAHQKKILYVDNHIGISIAGLTADARLLW